MGQALGIVGAAVGYYFGGPTGAQWGYAIGSAVGGMVDPTVVRGPSIGEVAAQTSAEGAPRSIIYGVGACYGNVIACGPALKTWEMGEEQGKGGGTKSQYEAVYRSYVIRICEGPIGAILRVWQDDKLVYDVRPGSPIVAESAQWLQNKTVYLGTEDQVPDVFSVINISGPDTPAYRGTAYMVVGLEDLTDRRGSLPQYRFEVAVDVEPYEYELPKIQAQLVAGGTGGGTFPSGFRFEGEEKGPGSVWMAHWSFGAYHAQSQVVDVYVQNAGGRLWQGSVTVPAGGSAALKVQVHADAVGGEWAVGFDRFLEGNMSMGLISLTGTVLYGPTADPGQSPPPFYLGGHPRFGIIQHEGELATAWVPNGGIGPPWGPEKTVLGYVGQPMLLADVVHDLHRRCGLPSALVDVTELTDEVQGVVLAGEYTAAAAIDSLRAPYKFDRSEHDGKLWYPKRGKAVVATLTLDDLADVPDVQRREQAIEYPAKHHLFFQHADSGYAVLKASSARSSPDVRVVGEASVQVPVVLSSDEAARITSMLHKIAWAEAEGEVKLSVPDSWLRLVASNCIGLSLRGQVSRLRIDQIDDAAGVRALTLRHDRQSAYTSAVSGIPIPEPSPPPSSIVGSTQLVVLDIPARIDSEDDLNYLVSAAGQAGGWYGWALQRSLDAGATYTQVLSSTMPGVIGMLLDALPAASEFYTDTTHTVRVQLLRTGQVLEDLTEQQFLSEGGGFALENSDGSWEVLQYRDATDEGGGVFSLRTLHRGQLNTGGSAHAAGARFVLLERAQHVVAQSSWIGQTLTHRAPSQGQAAELAAVQSAVFVGRSQREWPVADLRSTRSGDELTAAWAPRHRFGSDDAPVPSANFMGFRVMLDDGVNSITLDTPDTSVTQDVSTLASPVRVSVAALNRITGPGPFVSTDAARGRGFVPAGPEVAGQDIGATYAVQAGGDIVVAHTLTTGPALLWRLNDALVGSSINLFVLADVTGICCIGAAYFVSAIERSGPRNGKGTVVRVTDLGAGLVVTHRHESDYIVGDLCVCAGDVWAADYSGNVKRLAAADLSVVALVGVSPGAYRVTSDGTWVYGLRQADVVRIDPGTNSSTGVVWSLAAPSSTAHLRMLGGYLVLASAVGLQVIDPQAGTLVRQRADAGGVLTVVPGLIGCGGSSGTAEVLDAISLATISQHPNCYGLSILSTARAVASFLNTPNTPSSGQRLLLLKR